MRGLHLKLAGLDGFRVYGIGLDGTPLGVMGTGGFSVSGHREHR